ncbi:alginate O-acetyltransferase AlgX-related protein [Rhabdochromatium marinum]|uniref:alginate O-acetyltransferase AlgX-related protein n=1 Tax=Rhabdochromatium marinum TaxID=48729 RepID=UPI001903D9F1|nr:hypothetical protein [Rhabdochromatium marinum]
MLGERGWYFLNSRKLKNRAVGVYVDHERVDKWLDRILRVHAVVASHGRRFVFFSAPDKATIYPEFLPARIGFETARQESLDVLLGKLRKRGIFSVDLRPAIQAHKTVGPLYYKADTHWNRLGALVVYNQIVTELGLDDAAVAIDEVFTGFVIGPRESDLPPMIGDEESALERIPRFIQNKFLCHNQQKFDIDPHSGAYKLVSIDPSRPPYPFSRVLMVGDSFSLTLEDLMVCLAGEYLWIHHRELDSVPSIIEAFDPDLVLMEVVERLFY